MRQAMLLRGAEHLAEESVKQAQVGSMANRGWGGDTVLPHVEIKAA